MAALSQTGPSPARDAPNGSSTPLVTNQNRDDNSPMGHIIQRMRLGAAALCVVALGACTAIGGAPVPGGPDLQIVEHHVPHSAMRDHCERFVGFGQSPAACPEFDLGASRC